MRTPFEDNAAVQRSSNTPVAPQPDSSASIPRSDELRSGAVRSKILSSTKFYDITRSFSEAAAATGPGSLVKDDGFSLFDSVSALEISDPRMDSGVLHDGESFEYIYDVDRPLKAGEVVWLLDELSCLEVAWLSGYPLSQTLFTSMYIDRLLWPEPANIKEASFSRSSDKQERQSQLNRILQAYCVALVKCCDCVHRMVTAQHYFEEEDFASQLFHRNFLRNVAVDDAIKSVDESLAWLSDSSLPSDSREALDTRLRLRSLILQTLSGLGQNANSHRFAASGLLHMLDVIDQTRTLATAVPSSLSWKMQRTLASSVPPRPMISNTHRDVSAYVQDFFFHASMIRHFFDINSGSELMVAYRLYNFQGDQHSVYVRTLLQSFLSQGDKLLNKPGTREVLLNDMCKLVLPIDSATLRSVNDTGNRAEEHLQLFQAVESFLERVCSSFLNLIRVLCLNRCRLRRSLCHAVAEWDQIQADAEETDALVQELAAEEPARYPDQGTLTYQYPLSSWVYHYKLVQMELLIQMGFELRVYAVEEMYQMYWYLSHICSIHLSHLDRVGFFVRRHREQGTIRLGTAGEAEVGDTLRRLLQIFGEVKATEAFAGALHRLYLVIWRHSAHHQYHKKRYSSDQMRYELRMRPFFSVSVPEAMSFEVFLAATKLETQSDRKLLADSERYLTLAKRGWDEARKRGWRDQTTSVGGTQSERGFFDQLWSRDMTQILKACIGTGVAIATLSTRLTTGPDACGPKLPNLKIELPSPGQHDCWHNWWLVPRILQ